MAKKMKVPPAAAKMAGVNNPKSYKAMPPKGKSAAANKGGGRALRAPKKR
jgi:hypothetical protein